MTLRQTALLLGAISRYYPNFKKGEKAEMKAQLIRYNATLSHLDFKQACIALSEAIITMKYPPTALELKELMEEIEKAKQNSFFDEVNKINIWNCYSSPVARKYVDGENLTDEEIFEVIDLD